MYNTPMHTFTFIIIVNETVPLLARRITENAANAAKEKHNNHCPHTTSDTGASAGYFGPPLIATMLTCMFEGLAM